MTTANKSREIENRVQNDVPARLLDALSKVRGRYSSIEHVFYCIQVEGNHWIGVAGDGANGGYEHFDFLDGQLTISDVGYGYTLDALYEILGRTIK